jgi:DNA-binding LacI/PurR family transcriptional regulator
VATEHLIGLDCKRIGFLAYQGAASTINARMAGYHDALRDYGLPDRLAEITENEDPLAAPIEAELEAFVCVNDQVASLLMQAFLGRGIRIPEDVRLVGIDDVPYAKLLPVPLTTVRQPCQQIGEAAMRAMLERIRRPAIPPREILLEGELIVRKSCGAGNKRVF